MKHQPISVTCELCVLIWLTSAFNDLTSLSAASLALFSVAVSAFASFNAETRRSTASSPRPIGHTPPVASLDQNFVKYSTTISRSGLNVSGCVMLGSLPERRFPVHAWMRMMVESFQASLDQVHRTLNIPIRDLSCSIWSKPCTYDRRKRQERKIVPSAWIRSFRHDLILDLSIERLALSASLTRSQSLPGVFKHNVCERTLHHYFHYTVQSRRSTFAPIRRPSGPRHVERARMNPTSPGLPQV